MANEGRKKIWFIYTRESLSHKESKTPPFAAPWMDPEIVILGKTRQTEKDK